jgi:hypothetical protein
MRSAGAALFVTLVCLMNAQAQTAESFAAVWEKQHLSRIPPSDVTHSDLKKYLEQLKKDGIAIEEVGRSNANREIYQMEFGHGPLKVFMWSQMHGDEPTATSALIDLFAYLHRGQKDDLVKKISETITLRAVPMLNPDGAEMYKRRNLQDIDINRDAIDLATPEARLLKKLRDDWNPAIGFNLHNQNALTTVGSAPMQAAISFLVVYGDAEKTTNPGQERNTRLISAMVTALQKFIPGHIGRYDDGYAPTAFGDNFSAWGTATILIETGSLYGKDEMFLVKMNFVAFMTALEALATGSEATQSTSAYLSLVGNGSGNLVNVIFRNANIVKTSSLPGEPTAVFSIGDIAGVAERRRASFAVPTVIRGVGQLRSLVGLEEYDASAFNVMHRFARTAPGELAEFFFYKKDRVVEWASTELEKQFPPDAIFSNGKFIKGEGVVPRTRGN